MTEHDDLRDWDAAYLLGALSLDDRRRYERHLADCGACATAMSELAGLPGLLGKVSPGEAEATLEQPSLHVPDLLPRLVGHVGRRRRRVRRWALGIALGAVASAVAIGVAVGPGWFESIEPQPTSVAVQLEPVIPSPLVASVRLVEEQWGTRVEMECRYDAGDRYSGPADYAMYVTDADGDETRVATWTASAGQTATPSGTTSLAVAQIRSVDVRSVADGEVLLRGSL